MDFSPRWTRRTHQSCGTQLLLFEQRTFQFWAFFFPVSFGANVLKGCAKTVSIWRRHRRILAQNGENQIGSKLQDIVYQNICGLYFWFVICDFGLFKLTVNGICISHLLRFVFFFSRQTNRNLFDCLQISRRCSVLDRQVNWIIFGVFLMFRRKLARQ